MHREVMYTKFSVSLASDVYSFGDKLRILGLPLGPPGRLVMSGEKSPRLRNQFGCVVIEEQMQGLQAVFNSGETMLSTVRFL